MRDATELCVSAEGEVMVAGPAAAVCFVQPKGRRAAPAWDAHAVLRNVLSATRIRKLWLLGERIGDPRRGLGLPVLPASVDAVVVQDVALAVALGVLPGGSSAVTVHVLMTRFMSASVVLAKLAQHPGAKRTNVVVGYLPSYKGDRARPSGSEGAFASLRFEEYAEEPRVALPEACLERAHCLWPAWVE
ncbi:hypothetical protein EVJ58_g5208 [Rhodofomes roseus]|uniref:Uncharacterized protein n=1 Tax=Rhodofomes roseus TaxID=34475 RepID=A0A4Y9YDS3_9APHY|nr:hypothetical protein EVJ58_g5208 [Rhodofomes roseus]